MERRGRFAAFATGKDDPEEEESPVHGGGGGECPCEGAYNTGVPSARGPHYVWMAFLHYDNGDFRQEEWGRDYRILPMNWLTCKLSGSDLYHCQMFFWHQGEQTFVTFSVDSHQAQVHYTTQKEFKYGWTFLRLEVTQEQERSMYEFLHAQLGKPFNMLGATLLFFRPINTGHHTWFCSQLDTAALQVGGLVPHLRPEAVSPASLMRALLGCGEVPVLQSEHPVRTKHVWQRVDRHLSGKETMQKEECPFEF